MSGNIIIENLTFKYLSMVKPVFSDVNLNINESWKLGLVGRNGRGKTTFLKILLNELDYEGNLQSTLRFKYFPSYPAVHEELTTLEVLLQDNISIEVWQIEREFNLIGLSPDLLDRRFNLLSGGEQTKALLVKLFLNEHAFPLIDEPTNNLDAHGRHVVGEYLNQKNGFIVVSHDEHFLNQFVDHILAINKQSIDLISGNVETWKVEKMNADLLTQKKNEELYGEIKRLNNVSSQVNIWGNKRESSTKDSSERRLAAKQMKRAKAIKKRTEDMVEENRSLINNVEEEKDLKLKVNHPRKQVLSLRQFSILRDGRPLFEPIDIDVQPGERLFIEGKNGIGKSTLLNFILGQDKVETIGEYHIRLPNNCSTLRQTNQHILDIASAIKEYPLKQEREQFLYLLHQLGIKRSRFTESSSKHWSAGEQKKVFLANALLGHNELFIWDEVTNSLDIMVIQQLINSLNFYEPTIIGVDHNEYFVDAIATKRIELVPYQ
ncbi:ATP-binding cassette domain-containing protein [Alkalibacillus haloalkaliphilus]|uniref:ATP-binding cassette domain-containing protein n=1 Tax=Alkalibacillus haloalkaliphilus TaxID=94136 RepID=UPI002936C332|nr:ATP-binding cassette domain-containing protein [Alkalibacillus haloalkaliphilus]MDV2583202.1 ATP-binding cassette domain-containing protein [Alkalibacillus haloalkaliphilus]